MLIIDRFRQRELNDRSRSAPCDQVESEEIASGKIINFESGRKALERDRSMPEREEAIRRTSSGEIRIDRSAGVAESVVTILLVLVIAISLLLGMTWGF
jgi:hypothetical protein